MPANRFQPALLGGVYIGVITALPFIGALNACCCLWVVTGGLLTVYLQQQGQEQPVEAAQAVLGGLIAGVVGGVISSVLAALFWMWLGPMQMEWIQRFMQGQNDVPEEVQNMIEQMTAGGAGGVMSLMSMVVTVPIYAIFAMLGALLGLAFFRKKPAPVG